MDMAEAGQTSDEEERSTDSHPHAGTAAAAAVLTDRSSSPQLMAAACLVDAVECRAKQQPGHSVAAQLLAVIADLEQAHSTFLRREEEEVTGVILNL